MAVEVSETKEMLSQGGQRVRQTLVTPSLFHSETGPRVQITEVLDQWRMYSPGTFFLTFLIGSGPDSVQRQIFAPPPATLLTSIDAAKQLLGQA